MLRKGIGRQGRPRRGNCSDTLNIEMDIHYLTNANFIGQQDDGYMAPKCILTARAADALKKVQVDLQPFGLRLKVFNCYRPQRAVDQFIREQEMSIREISSKTAISPRDRATVEEARLTSQ